MNLDLGIVALASGLFLAFIFLAAWMAETGYLSENLKRHPTIYVLSLGVFISGWAYYSTLGAALNYGYGFLASSLGVTGAFMLASVLLKPILRLTQQHQLSSLADLFSFRFRSHTAGSLTTLLMIVAMMPLMAMQIKTVTESIALLTKNDWQAGFGAIFCLSIIIFTLVFGAKQISLRQKHEAVVFVIALETVMKLLAIVVLSIYVIWEVFGDYSTMETWLMNNQDKIKASYKTMEDGTWLASLFTFFASAIFLPHMYQMVFTENNNPKGLDYANWGMPLILFIFSLCVPILLWGCMALGLVESGGFLLEYLPLELSKESQHLWLVLLVYLGGLSSASGLIIVSTLALSGMALNHLVLPLYHARQHGDIYQRLQWARRLLIVIIVLASYGFYLTLNLQQNLTVVGIIALTALLQLFPGLMSTLYWPKGNSRGFIAGLIMGTMVWLFFVVSPPIFQWWFPTETLVSFFYTPDRWHYVTLISMFGNGLVFIFVSWFCRQNDDEIVAAEACAVHLSPVPQRMLLEAHSPTDFVQQLSQALGQTTAQKEVEKALADLGFKYEETRPYALRRLREQLEINFSSLMGPSIAQDIIKTYLPYKKKVNTQVDGDLNLMEERAGDYQSKLTGLAAELDSLRRYHRQTLQVLPMGACSLAVDHEILLWNQAMRKLTGIRAKEAVGSYLQVLPDPWGSLLHGFLIHQDAHLYKQHVKVGDETRWINLHKAFVESDVDQGTMGLVLVVEDLTETHVLEEQLMHAERLASIGRLAAGVAHEIGNPVTGIACLAQNMQAENPDDTEIQMASRNIVEQTKRIASITQSLMGFARSGTQNLAMQPVNLFQVTREAVDLLSLNKMGQAVEFHNLCQEGDWARGDNQRLVQVMINLLSNARDASSSGDVVVIRSSTHKNWVDWVIEDHGIGITPQLQKRLFEPFFTTKGPNEGTGLGLSMVYSIVEDHQGMLNIQSPAFTEGQPGTRIKVRLPRADAPT